MTVQVFSDILQWVLILGLGASNFFLWVQLVGRNNSTHQITAFNPFGRGQELKPPTEAEADKLQKDPFENIV